MSESRWLVAARRVTVVLVAVLAVIAVVGAVSVGGDGGVATANHGSENADFVVEPTDRTPGATDVEYKQRVVGQAGTDFETLEQMRAVYEGGSWEGCGPDNSETFGIDRGNTHDGYETDESLEENVEEFSAGEDVFEVDFYGDDGFGSSTHLDDGDEIVSVATCVDNPDEPGWYQIEGSTSGVTSSGEEATVGDDSHYFWICDCEDEGEAREELGPPPSEAGDGDSTPTPESDGGEDTGSEDGDETAGEDSSDSENDSDDDSGEGDSDDSGEDSSDDGSDGGNSDDSSDADQDSAPTATSTAEPTETEVPAEWDDERVQTPTPGAGPGFGGLGAVVGILLATFLSIRRR